MISRFQVSFLMTISISVFTFFLIFYFLSTNNEFPIINKVAIINHKNRREYLKSFFHDIENEKNLIREIDKLKEKVWSKDYKKELTQLKISAEYLPDDIGKLPENFDKNCINRTMPFDYNRVILSSDDNCSDYINANYVDGFNKKNKFIVTQGKNQFILSRYHKKTIFPSAPLNNTINDFWRMIWEQKVYVIGMSTTFFDETRNKTQSIEYWGQHLGETKSYGNICVKKMRGETNFDFVTTTLELTHLKVVKTDKFLSFFSLCVII